MSLCAVVTGASCGLGYSLSKHLCSLGYSVIAAARTESLLSQLSDECRELKPADSSVDSKGNSGNNIGKLIPVRADIASDVGRNAIVEAAKTYLAESPENGIQYLVHNAAILEVKPLMESDIEASMAVNTVGPLILTQSLLPLMEKSIDIDVDTGNQSSNGNDGKRILMISSGLAHKAMAGVGAYCGSKAALFMLQDVLRMDLKQRFDNSDNNNDNSKRILVASARPGVISTRMQVSLRTADDAVFPTRSNFESLFEGGKLYSAEKVASFVAWLLTEVSDSDFEGKSEWDVRDEWHQQKWLKE